MDSGVHSYELSHLRGKSKPRLQMPLAHQLTDEMGQGTSMMTPITQTLHLAGAFPSTASTSTVKCLDVCIFLRDGTGHEFSVESGKKASAQDLSDLMQSSLDLPVVASDLFCLWLSSPLLSKKSVHCLGIPYW